MKAKKFDFSSCAISREVMKSVSGGYKQVESDEGSFSCISFDVNGGCGNFQLNVPSSQAQYIADYYMGYPGYSGYNITSGRC